MSVERREGDIARSVDLATIRVYLGVVRPLFADLNELESVDALTVVQQCGRCPGKLSPVIRADGIRPAVVRRAVKQQDHPFDLVQLNQVSTLASQLLGAHKIASTRRKGATAARHVKPIEAGEAQLHVQKLIRLLLEASIGTGDHKGVRAID
ncbi:MAG: hypothetical protein WKF55_00655 [Gemmatimonadaceae bacterium]